MLSVLKTKSTLILPKFDLESGITLHSVEVVYKTWGTLNSARNNVMVVCHPFTGNVDADEWWGTLMGRGRAFDPTRFFIFCANVLGSPYGTSSPVSINPSSGRRYGPEFPDTTIRDDVRLHKLVLDYLGVSSVAVVIGGSMGGMAALEWPLCFPGFVKRIIPMATCAKHSAWCIGWGEAQRQAIYSDAAFQGGYYERQPTSGLAAARMAGLLTYRSRDSYEQRFGRRTVQSPDQQKAQDKKGLTEDTNRPLYSAQSYLLYQGAKFAAKFDANCYIHITHKMDTHDITRDRVPPGLDEAQALSLVLGELPAHALILSIDTDGLCLPVEQKILADGIPKAELATISSLAGHDGFLVECERINDIVVAYLRRQLQQFYGDGGNQVNSTQLVGLF
ncbi:Alpha/Beta hydrolase protein [Mycena rosella]|uniref:Alpha/Beta hydrolase protein n=1 Tax=Mycena rosella TaxID=1033263 RepID=A0AAD7DJ16_MYCRO|nr:Alpha/Beta hydrolase protein [Mycena rosella]